MLEVVDAVDCHNTSVISHTTCGRWAHVIDDAPMRLRAHTLIADTIGDCVDPVLTQRGGSCSQPDRHIVRTRVHNSKQVGHATLCSTCTWFMKQLTLTAPPQCSTTRTLHKRDGFI